MGKPTILFTGFEVCFTNLCLVQISKTSMAVEVTDPMLEPTHIVVSKCCVLNWLLNSYIYVHWFVLLQYCQKSPLLRCVMTSVDDTAAPSAENKGLCVLSCRWNLYINPLPKVQGESRKRGRKRYEVEGEELWVVTWCAVVGHINSQEFSLPMQELHKIKPA